MVIFQSYVKYPRGIHSEGLLTCWDAKASGSIWNDDVNPTIGMRLEYDWIKHLNEHDEIYSREILPVESIFLFFLIVFAMLVFGFWG